MVRPSLRFQILERDGFRCRYCGASAGDGAVLHVDHIHPRAFGGSDDPENLVTACHECNIGKSARLLGVTEQPVIFRGRTKEKRSRRRKKRYAVNALVVESWEEGSHCSTPLKVATIGYQLGLTTYMDSLRYLIRIGCDSALLPPMRHADKSWFELLHTDQPYALEMTRTVVESLEIAA